MRAYNRAGENQFNIRLEDEWQHSIQRDFVDEHGNAGTLWSALEEEGWYWELLDDADYALECERHEDDEAGYDWRDEQWRDEGWYEPHARYRNEYWCRYEYGPQSPSVEPDHASYWQEYLRRNQAATCVVFYGSPGVYPAA